MLSALFLAVCLMGSAAGVKHLPSKVPLVCMERISPGDGIFLQEHPAGNSLVVATQGGVISLLSKTPVGQGPNTRVLGTFLNIRGKVLARGTQGLLSFAFHPKFLQNGRFFVSYICDSTQHPACQAKCACPQCGQGPCTNVSIIEEYRAPGNPAAANALQKQAVATILKIGRPTHHDSGGHIWFASDGYLYFASGDGAGDEGLTGDPFGVAQNGGLPFGKILRLDVDKVPQGKSYGIPKGNPFLKKPGVLPEIYALGLRNPWRCSEDKKTRKIFCGDVGQDAAEEVDSITKGGNYGWSYYEATLPFRPVPAGFKPTGSKLKKPVIQYVHPARENGQAVVGGYVYRAKRNQCLQGLYVFGDAYHHAFMYVADAFSKSVAKPVRVPIACARGNTCDFSNVLFSWAQDKSGEVYHLRHTGIYRIVDAGACNAAC